MIRLRQTVLNCLRIRERLNAVYSPTTTCAVQQGIERERSRCILKPFPILYSPIHIAVFLYPEKVKLRLSLSGAPTYKVGHTLVAQIKPHSTLNKAAGNSPWEPKKVQC